VKIQDLEDKINERAKVNVAQKVKAFRAEIDAALTKLFGNGSQSCERFGSYGYAGNVTRKKTPEYEIANAKLDALNIAIAANEPHPSNKEIGWPRLLWEKERESIRNELLAKMDLMQQLLVAKPLDPADDVPCVE